MLSMFVDCRPGFSIRAIGMMGGCLIWRTIKWRATNVDKNEEVNIRAKRDMVKWTSREDLEMEVEPEF
jgi:hypothetical protein